MSILNNTCPICTQLFNDVDNVYSTSCGHLFHAACINDWRARSGNCPVCNRAILTPPHKLYLCFDELEDNSTSTEEMKKKLKSSLEKITDLQVHNSELEVKFMKLQDRYTALDNQKRILDRNIKEMNDIEVEYMQLQRQYTEGTEHIKNLEDRIQQLCTANEAKSQELKLIISENISLNDVRVANQSVMPESVLNHKIMISEQKLKNISKELEKEINTSSQLSVNKMKLESIVKNLNITDKNKQKTNEHNTTTEQNFMQNGGGKKRTVVPLLSQSQAETRSRCITIKNLPAYLIIKPLELTIINIASRLRMSISANDLLEVKFLNAAETRLFAEFRSSDLKETFLKKKCFLYHDQIMKPMKIREFMDENVFELYRYAKDLLQPKGFITVFCVNNKIYALKFKGQRQATQIMSKQHVNTLCNGMSNINKPCDGATANEN